MKMRMLFTLASTVLWVTAAPYPEATAASALQTVTVATSAAGQSGYLAALIEAKGIAREHGLKINNMMMDFTEAANALRLGRAVAGMMQPTTALNLRKAGTEVRLFAGQIWSGNAFVVRKDAPYKSITDLKGKKIGNFSRVTGAYFFSAVIAKERGLDIEKDFQSVPAETGALIALLERGEVEAINMFEPHITKLVLSGKYRVLVDFDAELNKIFGTPPLKTGMAVLKETAEKQPGLVKAIRGAYVDGIKFIKSGQDKEFFESKAKEFFGLRTPEEIAAGMKQNRDNFAGVWGETFFQAQNKILQRGIALGLLPDVGNLNDLWIK
ncbi:MAG: PhnD/SsuA/transferrin family substrate-binding protein [Deltaproteobacteria bacterium]|nr:PhnD/SsuA/transferrin family substrate-binding protein [Deltaproteobacteria bacterium]